MRLLNALTICLLWVQFGCKGTKSNNAHTEIKDSDTLDFTAGQPLIIYKTRANYKTRVGIELMKDDTYQVVSYPSQDDIYRSGRYAYPIELNKGYLLDQQGINQRVAFLSLSQNEYVNLDTTIDSDFVKLKILDNNPLKEMYFCGNYNQISRDSSLVDRLIRTNFNGCVDLMKSQE